MNSSISQNKIPTEILAKRGEQVENRISGLEEIRGIKAVKMMKNTKKMNRTCKTSGAPSKEQI
jgi:hypothetical protein